MKIIFLLTGLVTLFSFRASASTYNTVDLTCNVEVKKHFVEYGWVQVHEDTLGGTLKRGSKETNLIRKDILIGGAKFGLGLVYNVKRKRADGEFRESVRAYVDKPGLGLEYFAENWGLSAVGETEEIPLTFSLRMDRKEGGQTTFIFRYSCSSRKYVE